MVVVKLWEDFFALVCDSIGWLSSAVKTDEFYCSTFEEQREDFVLGVAVS